MADEKFELVSSYQPTGDQPQAIETLVKGVERGDRCQTLLGVTGSGKTFTMANVIAQCNRPTLVLAHNKTLAAQLCTEFRSFFPNNAVEYFVSYYDYYQPEAYIPSTDTYIEKDSAINDEIDRLRHSATAALSERRRDTIGIGNIALKMEEPPYQQSQGEPLLKRCLFQRQNVLFRFVPRVLRQVVAGGLAAGKLIAAFVLGMAVVPAHPFQRDAVAIELDLQALPEIAVLDRFLGGGLPAVFPPAREPFFFHGMAQVLRVRVQRDRARLFQLFEPRDGRHDFHTVVRGVRVAAGEFLFMPFAAQDAAPASATGVAEA